MSARYYAPAIAYPFSRPRWVAVALLLAWLCLLFTLLGWYLQGQHSALDSGLIGAALLIAGALLYRQWQQWPTGRLLWNGEYWQLEALNLPIFPEQTQQALTLKVGLDGGNWLWLQIFEVNPARSMLHRRKLLWIFIAQQHSPAQWGDLRRAVYSSVAPLAEQG